MAGKLRSPTLDELLLHQLASQNLERAALRQLTAKLDGPRHLIGGEVLAGECQQLLRGCCLPWLQHHERLDALAPLLVRDADRGCLEYGTAAYPQRIQSVPVALGTCNADDL